MQKGSKVKEERENKSAEADGNGEHLKELERKLFDLEITNRGKDYFIDQLKQEREKFHAELMTTSRRVGELETELRQLSAPRGASERIVPNNTEADRNS